MLSIGKIEYGRVVFATAGLAAHTVCPSTTQLALVTFITLPYHSFDLKAFCSRMSMRLGVDFDLSSQVSTDDCSISLAVLPTMLYGSCIGQGMVCLHG